MLEGAEADWLKVFSATLRGGILFDIGRLEGPPCRLNYAGPPRMEETADALHITQTGFYDLRYERATGRGEIRVYRTGDDGGWRLGRIGLRSALTAFWAATLPLRGGFLLHASGIEVGGLGIVFVGQSGAGKSTIASMFPDDAVLNDELIAITDVETRPMLHATPFSKRPPRPRRRSAVPLAMVTRIEKAQRIAISFPDDRGAALRHVIRCLGVPEGVPEIERRAFYLAGALVSSSRYSVLKFPLNAAQVLTTVSQAVGEH